MIPKTNSVEYIGKMERAPKEWDINEETPQQFQETVNTLIETLIKPECFKQDLLFSLLLVLMNENNFRLPKDIGNETVSIVDYIVLMKRCKTMHEAVLLLNGYENITVKLIMTPMNDVMLINATLLEICSETYSACFSMNSYFVSCGSAFNIPTSFANIDELSNLFKDKIIAPIKNTILNYNNTPGCALGGLPIDILHLILIRLSLQDVLNLSETCKRINGVVNEDCLWSHLYSRDFLVRHKCEEKGWRDMYKEVYSFKIKEEREYQMRSTVMSAERAERFIPRHFTADSRWEVIL